MEPDVIYDLVNDAIDITLDVGNLPPSFRNALTAYKDAQIGLNIQYSIDGFLRGRNMTTTEAWATQVQLVDLRDGMAVLRANLQVAMIQRAAANGPYTQEEFDAIKDGIKDAVANYFGPFENAIAGYIQGFGAATLLGEAGDAAEAFGNNVGRFTDAVLNMSAEDWKALTGFDKCFLAGTPIDMWDGSQKPIEDIVADDIVVSYDARGQLVPGRVTGLNRAQAAHVLDVFGLMVTPAHVTFCAEGRFAGGHVPVIDILRSDGALMQKDGAKIRAATGCCVGSALDQKIHVVTGDLASDGAVNIRQSGQIRLGTRMITDTGQDICLADVIEAAGGRITAEGLISQAGCATARPFHWTFSHSLPKPEDYVLQRSDLTLAEIYQMDAWEGQPSLTGTPYVAGVGLAQPASTRTKAAMRTNRPLSLRT